MGVLGAGAAAAAALAYALTTPSWRPLDNTEAELLFAASRVRSGFALFVDPRVGATDYGPVPARYYALYTPLWAWVLSLVPAAAARTVARLVASASWFGILAFVANQAPRSRRAACWIFAGFAAGSFFLLRSAVVAAPDATAAAIATFALMQAVRRDRLGPGAAGLFALAALLKPNVLGLGAGALGAHLVCPPAGRRAIVAPLAAGAFVLVGAAVLFQTVSHGAWISHLLGGSAQDIRLARGIDEVASRFPFLGLPQVLLFGAALAFGRPSRPALAALGTSTVWAAFSMAKSGSTTNYWFEPTLAALVVLATTEPRPAAAGSNDRFALWTTLGVSLLALLSAVVTLPAILLLNRQAKAAARAIDEVRAACPLKPGEMAVASDSGLEYELSGRLAVTAFSMSYVLRQGRFPLALWSSDLALPAVRWFVTRGPTLEGEPSGPESPAFFVELRPQIQRDFGLRRQIGNFWIYGRR